MVEKGFRGGIPRYVNRYVKGNNEYMKDYKELSHLKYCDVNSFYN